MEIPARVRTGWALLGSSLAIACASDAPSPVQVLVAPALLAPKGILTGVTRVTLSVYDASGSIDCEVGTGHLAGVTDGLGEVASADLLSTGCAAGAAFCGRLELARSESPRAFAAKAYVNDTLRAAGCTKAVASQDSLPLAIKMIRSTAPAFCFDGQVQSKEQCEPTGPSDPVCDQMCQSREVLLSGGTEAAGTSAGTSGDKTRPSFVWPAGSGRAGRFLSFFGDNTPPNQEVTMRVLGADFAPYTEQGPALRDGSFFLPNERSKVLTSNEANDQSNPAAVAVGSNYYVVYQDNNATPTGSVDIRLRSLDAGLTAQQALGNPIGINGVAPNGNGESGAQTLPAIAAGPGGKLFIAWQDDAAGRVVGRTWTPGSNAYGPQVELSSGTNNRSVSVAGRPAGWLVVWESGTDVKWRTLDDTGAATGPEQLVNDSTHRGAQEQPALASLSDGRFAVAWTDRGAALGANVFLQRFDAAGKPIAGDQATALNDVAADGDQTSPALASATALGGSYAVAWVDEATGDVRARLAGGSAGFLFNNVDGTQSEFKASVEGRRTRGAPAIAVGGAGPYVAIGWEDRTGDSKAGIYARRFPIPTE